jgi:hypothetical protein
LEVAVHSSPTITRRAVLIGAAASTAAVAAVAIPTLAQAEAACSFDPDQELAADRHWAPVGPSANDERATVERLIADWQAAIDHHEVLFDANDRDGSVSDAEVYAALAPIDDALEALCRYRPFSPAARLRRSDFLAEELTRSTYGSEALMFRMFRALTV